MKRRLVCLLGQTGVMAGLLIGCNRPTPVVPAKAPVPPTPPTVVTSEPSAIDRKPEPTEATDTALDTTTAPAPAASEPAQAMPPPKTARVMLLTADGPLLIDLHANRGDVSMSKAFEQTIDDILQIAQDESETPITWKALLTHPRFREGQFGNPPTGNYQAQVQTIRQYDTLKNDRVDRAELIRYLTNNQTGRAISFLTSNDRRIESKDGSVLARWLDQDGNRKLGADELHAASERLQQKDNNDDGILTLGELTDTTTANNGMSTTRSGRRQSFTPKTGWLFESGNDNYPWSDIRVAWETLYGAGQPVRREDLAMGARLFDAMDLDSNDSLDNIEMEMLTEIEPDLALELDFAATPPQLNLLASRFPPKSIRALIQHQPNRITLRLPQLTLDLFGIGAADATTPQQAQAQAFFKQADKDDDGELTVDEFEAADMPFLGFEFSGFDLDGNERVSQVELTTIAKQRGMINQNRMRIRADSQADAIFPALDTNADGRLDAREIAAARSSLLALDRNDDGQVRSNEFRPALLVGVVVGAASQPNATDASLNVPIVQRTPSASTPKWFAGMDRNADQSISWREFLGTKQQFEQLDKDADGFVDASEANSNG